MYSKTFLIILTSQKCYLFVHSLFENFYPDFLLLLLFNQCFFKMWQLPWTLYRSHKVHKLDSQLDFSSWSAVSIETVYTVQLYREINVNIYSTKNTDTVQKNNMGEWLYNKNKVIIVIFRLDEKHQQFLNKSEIILKNKILE